jgi:hypothetical protein
MTHTTALDALLSLLLPLLLLLTHGNPRLSHSMLQNCGHGVQQRLLLRLQLLLTLITCCCC